MSPNVREILSELDIDCEDSIVLRRTLSRDGKSRAWINDVPVSVKTLKSVGDDLVEVHGQFANHALLDSAMHRVALDNFATKNIDGFNVALASTRAAFSDYNNATKRLNDLREMLARSALERDFLEHNVAELRALNVVPGEEGELADKRAAIINAEKNAAILTDAADAIGRGGNTLDAQIFSVAHILERIKTKPNPYSEEIDKLYSAAEMVADVAGKLSPEDIETDTVDMVEERLFAIRAAARKHHVTPDELPVKLAEMESELNTINNSDAELKKLTADVANFEKKFNDAAQILSEMRTRAATELRTRLLRELPDLKLANADFMAEISKTSPSAMGFDDIVFMIKTNPGTPFAPLHRAASGGELARLMLAMRVILSDSGAAHTFVFDEVDTGISGSTAAAVGNRLNRLANGSQAIVITHSAQVAGYADKHFKIEKTTNGEITTTNVREISGNEQLNEIARIISGAEITPESLATAKTLIK